MMRLPAPHNSFHIDEKNLLSLLNTFLLLFSLLSFCNKLETSENINLDYIISISVLWQCILNTIYFHININISKSKCARKNVY